MSDSRKKLGRYGEDLAAKYLIELDYRIIHRNWRCKSGELDLIALDGATLVFVEVRTRRLTGTFGTPQESVDKRKQNQVRNTAQFYMHQHQKHGSQIRFDLIAIEMNREGELLRIGHIKHAF